MKSVEKLVTEIAELGHDYSPGVSTRQLLSTKTIVPVIGPSAIGKNTIMETILKLSPNYGRSVGFTTRPRRDGESADNYAFIPHTPENLEAIKQRLINKELVQVAVFPTTNMIYGSGPEDYQKPFVVIDFLASAMQDLAPLGFKKIQPIALAAEVEEWDLWLKERMHEVTNDEFLKRMREATSSLQWVIENKEKVHIQLNSAGELKQTAESVMAVCEGKYEASNQHIHLISKMLKHAEKLIANANST